MSQSEAYSLKRPGSILRLGAALLMVVLLFAATAWSYRLASGMTWQFDDLANLRGLAGASHWAGLRDFVFGGTAGPSGRPLSLLAFVPNYADWTGNPWGFARGNLLLHGLNALLAALLFTELWRAAPIGRRMAPHAALAWGVLTAALWAVLAIHATGILMPVQRMTLVSGFATLGTLWLYVLLRRHFAGSQGWWPIFCLSSVLAAGTLVSVLGKENGALTVSFAAVLETLWLRHLRAPAKPFLWRAWVWLAWLALPILLVARYLIRGWHGLMAAYEYYRPFNLAERLATEPVILWEYVRQTLAPRAALLGPFHDGHVIYNWAMWQPWLAVAAWLGLVLAVLAWAQRGSLLARACALAVVFFLVGHQIESTFVALELYFEHRNYMPTLGIALAITLAVYTLWHHAPSRSGKAVAGLMAAAFVGWQLIAVQQVSANFGNPWLGADMWYRYHPSSQRAVQTLAWQYGRQGFVQNALDAFDDSIARDPEPANLHVQALVLSCELFPDDVADHRKRFAAATKAVKALRYGSAFHTGLQELGQKIRTNNCSGIDLTDYMGFLEIAANNEAIKHSAKVRHHVHFELSLTAEELEQSDAAVDYAQKAYYDFPASASAAVRAATLMFSNHRLDDAIEWTAEVKQRAPNGIQRWAWEQQFGSLYDALMDVRTQLQNAEMQGS